MNTQATAVAVPPFVTRISSRQPTRWSRNHGWRSRSAG